MVEKIPNDLSIVLVTGPLGAGRSTAINAFEDLGYETIDNLPMSLLPRLLQGPPLSRPLALCIDVRTRDFSVETVLEAIDLIKSSQSTEPSLLFLTCQKQVLVRRYSETRRRHPMAANQAPLVGIETESELIDGLEKFADILIDTTEMSPHELKAEIGNLFAQGETERLSLTIQSFSYKRGVPRGIDMVIDCRFLANPHWNKSLRSGSGLDHAVQNFVTSDDLFPKFFEKLVDMTTYLLPAYLAEGKIHFSIGLGCTGGQHRSVCVAEKLRSELESVGWPVGIRHRELERRSSV